MGRAQLLHALQEVDLARDAARRRVREINSLLTESAELRAARQEAETLRAQLVKLGAQRKDLELESQTLDEKIKSVEDRLYSGEVRNPKELNDLQLDAASLRRRKAGLDEQQLELLMEIEQVEGEGRRAEQSLAHVRAEWEGSQSDMLAEHRQLSSQIELLDAQREERRAAARAEDLELYDQLRPAKKGHVVAFLSEGTCGVCGNTPSINTVRLVQRNQSIVTCSTCGRILMTE
jgi:predicted  nucleic acid-binding Zn-ribbon protein